METLWSDLLDEDGNLKASHGRLMLRAMVDYVHDTGTLSLAPA